MGRYSPIIEVTKAALPKPFSLPFLPHFSTSQRRGEAAGRLLPWNSLVPRSVRVEFLHRNEALHPRRPQIPGSTTGGAASTAARVASVSCALLLFLQVRAELFSPIV
jgi:hypothetical protein